MIEIICHGCLATAHVNRVTAGLRCVCGSHDIDLLDPATLPEVLAKAHGPGTGWGRTMPDPLKGWNEYAGPMPGANPNYVGEPAQPYRCPNCKGSGWSLREKCRACQGSGLYHPTTSQTREPQVAKHPGQTKRPFMGQRRTAAPEAWQKSPFNQPAPGRELHSPEDVIRHSTPGWSTGDGVTSDTTFPNTSPHLKTRDDTASADKYSDQSLRERRTVGYPMHEAECPECGAAPTHLVNDYKDDAWWHCRNCGPLVNVDRNPHINPYDPPEGFEPKPKQFSSKPPKTARFRSDPPRPRVFAMLTSVTGANPGLSFAEALTIVRTTVAKFPE
jgi:hypothetical protein